MFNQKTQYAFHARESFWTQMGGRVNKHFFSSHGPRHERNRVSQVIDSRGVLQRHPNVVMHIALDFYASLLSTDAITQET